jgi:hypothetical protein
MNKELITNIVAGSIGFGVGCAVGYVIHQKKKTTTLEELVSDFSEEEELDILRQKINKTEAFATPEDALNAIYAQTVQDLGYSPTEDEEDESDGEDEDLDDLEEDEDEQEDDEDSEEDGFEEDIVNYDTSVEASDEEPVEELRTINVFVEAENNPILDADVTEFETKKPLPERNPLKPYVISIDEFMSNESDYRQISISYFEGDDVLCDDRQIIITDKEGTVGVQNLDFFGELSHNDDILYVRNQILGCDFEICREPGKYEEVVLGVKSRAIKPPIKKMRDDD